MEKPMTDIEKLEQAILAIESQRTELGDMMVATILAPLNEKLQLLRAKDPPKSTPEQRKLVTVLFADVFGFTAISERLDAEDVRDQMNLLWGSLDQVLVAHGAVIDKHIGDAVMALFGTPTAREDDPEQAVQAALEMQARIRAFTQEKPDFPLQIRIGLNTGPVLLGEIGTQREFTAMGDTVNLAARLEKSAPVGGILISHDTYRHVRGLFDLQTQSPLSVKGKTEQVQTYQVLQARPRAFRLKTRGVEGVETRMIGRETELISLETALRSVITDQKQQAITVVGDAGVGKSRLLYEFTTWAEILPENWRIFKGRASESTRTLPYSLLRDIFTFRFEIAESDPLWLAQKKLEDGILGFMTMDTEAAMKAHFIGQLLGFDFSSSPHLRGILQDAVQIRDRAFHYLVQFFSAVTHEQDLAATVLFLEDIHWADGGSLDAFEYLVANTRSLPIFILALARPTLYEHRPHWGAGMVRIDLQSLSDSDSNRLVDEILKKLPNVPEALRSMVVGRAEGNPFYVEELIKMLIDKHAIIPETDQWQVIPERLAAVHIPATLTGVLQTRLDSLNEAEREALQCAAVIGKVFWDIAVDYLEQVHTDGSTGNAARSSADIFKALRHRELIYARTTTAFIGSSEYIFKHTLLRDVTYETVLKRLRRQYHALAAAWLVERSGERANEYAGLIAEHFENAGDPLQAVEWYCRAGKQAAFSYATKAAIDHYKKALNLSQDISDSDSNAARVIEIFLSLGSILDLLGRWDEADDYLRKALEHTRKLTSTIPGKDLAFIARCQIMLGRLFFNRGEYGAALIWLDQARLNWESLNDQAGLCQVLIEIGKVFSRVGEYALSQHNLEKGLSMARSTQDRSSMALALNILGNIATEQGDDGLASTLYTQSMNIRNELGDKRGITDSLNNLANMAVNQGNLEEGQKLYEECLSLNRAIGYKWGTAVSLNNIGNVAYARANYAMAVPFFEESLGLMREIGDRWGVANALIDLGLVALAQENIIQAGDIMTESLKMCAEMGDKRGILFCLIGLSGTASKINDHQRAVRLSAAADALINSLNLQLEPEVQPVHDQAITIARQSLGENVFSEIWAKAQEMPLEQAISYALRI